MSTLQAAAALASVVQHGQLRLVVPDVSARVDWIIISRHFLAVVEIPRGSVVDSGVRKIWVYKPPEWEKLVFFNHSCVYVINMVFLFIFSYKLNYLNISWETKLIYLAFYFTIFSTNFQNWKKVNKCFISINLNFFKKKATTQSNHLVLVSNYWQTGLNWII